MVDRLPAIDTKKKGRFLDESEDIYEVRDHNSDDDQEDEVNMGTENPSPSKVPQT